MDIKESINKAKLDLVEQRAFWWFIKDLAEYIEVVDLEKHAKSVIEMYKAEQKSIQEEKEKNKKWVQRWLSF